MYDTLMQAARDELHAVKARHGRGLQKIAKATAGKYAPETVAAALRDDLGGAGGWGPDVFLDSVLPEWVREQNQNPTEPTYEKSREIILPMHVPDSETYCASYAATVDEGLDYLRTEHQLAAPDFDYPDTYAVIRVAERLHREGDSVTPHAIRHEMKQEGIYEDRGGHPWWSDFVGIAGEGDDVDLHARKVRLASRLRTVDEPAEKIHKVCTNGHRPEDAMEEVEGLTTDLLEAQADTETSVMDGEDIAAGIMDMVTSETPANLTLATGWPRYDRRFGGLIQNRINVIAARTDHGKSAAADQILLNVARRYAKQDEDKCVIKFDLENDESAVQLRFSR